MKLIVFCLLPIIVFGQTHICGVDLIHKTTNTFFNAQGQKHNETNSLSSSFIIPVVFHILHQNGPENISDAQICDAIKMLNEDFNKKNSDTINTINSFISVAGNSKIEFRLAKKDPNGNATSGINRILTPLTYGAFDNAKINQWPPNNYLNIWVVDSLATIGGINGVKGYAYLPDYASLYPQHDGVLIRHDCVGRFGSGDIYQPIWARILTHEIGHYLNLLHIWGSNFGVGTVCGGDDFVNDTPPTKGSLWCNNLYLSTCGYLDNVQNFMNYSYCYTMFTHGQATRMHNTLNSGVANRNNLHTFSNLALTGTTLPNNCVQSSLIENQKHKNQISFFPNPSQNELSFNINEQFERIIILNFLGQKINFEYQQVKNNEYKIIFDPSIKKGIYSVQIKTKNNILNGKFIKE